VIVEFCFVHSREMYSREIKDLRHLELITRQFAERFSQFLEEKGFKEEKLYQTYQDRRILKKMTFVKKGSSAIEEMHISRRYPVLLYTCKMEFEGIPSSNDFLEEKNKREKNLKKYLFEYSNQIRQSRKWRSARIKQLRPRLYTAHGGYLIFYQDKESNWQDMLTLLEKEIIPPSFDVFRIHEVSVGISNTLSVIKLENTASLLDLEDNSGLAGSFIPLQIKNMVYLRSILVTLAMQVPEITEDEGIPLRRKSVGEILEVCALFDSILNPISLYVRQIPQNQYYEEVFDICGMLEGFDYIINSIKVFTNLSLQQRIRELTWVLAILTVFMILLIIMQIGGESFIESLRKYLESLLRIISVFTRS
jgi:hypothetical protein